MYFHIQIIVTYPGIVMQSWTFVLARFPHHYCKIKFVKMRDKVVW
jgi:hypothetical protein